MHKCTHSIKHNYKKYIRMYFSEPYYVYNIVASLYLVIYLPIVKFSGSVEHSDTGTSFGLTSNSRKHVQLLTLGTYVATYHTGNQNLLLYEH